MTSTTTNLALTLYDPTADTGATFLSYRTAISGTAPTSNFYKIDTAYGVQAAQITELQNKSGSIPIVANYISAGYYEAAGVSQFTGYITGMTIILSLDTTSSGTVTLNINPADLLGTKSLMKVNSSGTPVNLTGSDLVVGRNHLFMYDGTRWLWVSAPSADQISIVGTSGNIVTVSSDNTLLGTTAMLEKASGAELDTGTDDIKFSTAKALKDSHNVPSVVPGSSGNGLESNGTDWISAIKANVGGWIPGTGTWSYSSADAPTFVISINADVTGLIGIGDKIKLTQTTVKYFIVTAMGAYSAGATLVTVYGGTDYTLVSASITLPFYSHSKTPFGFPMSSDKWTVEVTDITNQDETIVVLNTWYNTGSISISMPIGAWNVWYRVNLQSLEGGTYSINVALSTANNSASDADLLAQYTSVGQYGMAPVTVQKTLVVSSKTPYYLNQMNSSGTQDIRMANGAVKMIIRAVCSYL